MFSLALGVKVIDNDTQALIDEVEWPLVHNNATDWSRGLHGTTGTLFWSLQETINHYNQVMYALLEGCEPRNKIVTALWSSILSARGGVKHSGGNKKVEFELLLINRTPNVLERTPITV